VTFKETAEGPIGEICTIHHKSVDLKKMSHIQHAMHQLRNQRTHKQISQKKQETFFLFQIP
jgi:hypothetical protein